jgi:mono/diheme cytochrome c family protein
MGKMRPALGLIVRMVVVVVVVVGGRDGRAADEAAQVDFSRQILPILSENCFACHGPDATKREADLRLDEEAGAKAHAIVPGQPDESVVMERLLSDDDDLRMPPAKLGKQLSDEQIQLIRRWIEQGAPWAQHWAFVPPAVRDVPMSSGTSWPQNEIDHFVWQRLRTEQLQPAAPATRAAWLRRVSFDLVGLPPTPKEVTAFENDQSADAYEKVVDRLLRSPHYGERMAIEWLDIARFADTNGYQNDFNRSMWPWRDWVISAYNNNMPANQFLMEQVAGDLLQEPTPSQLVATGFNRNHRMVTEGGSIDEEWRVENVVDRVETTATAFLGLTMGCARCHDHKYDPISRKDFYRFFAFFNNVDERGVYTETRGNVPPLIPVPTEEERQKLAAFDRRITELEQARARVAIDLPKFFKDTSPDEIATKPSPSAAVELLGEQRLGETAKYTAGELSWGMSPVGPALELTGALESHVDAGQAVAFDADQPFGWSLWVRVDRPGALLSKMDDQHGFRGFDTIVLDDFRLKVHLIDTWSDNALAVTTKSSVPREAWTHIAVSYDGSRKAEGIQVWLDGTLLPLNLEQRELKGTFKTDQPLRLGRRSTSLPLDGAIADLRLYNEALTTEGVDLVRRRGVRAHVGELVESREALPPVVREYLERAQSGELQQQLQGVRDERANFEKSLQTVMIMRDRAEYRPTYVLKRGQYDLPDQSETLWPEIPEFLGQLPEGVARNRLALAKWLVDPSHPLVARVMVNRIWQRMFGVGLVASADNFGVQGEVPSHPELLDWLAIRFIESGWDMKQMHKLIALSATYQQSASAPAELIARDPKNRLLARGPRHRLPAELVRDNALAVSGLLATKIGGRSVKPYQPDGLWDELAGGANGGPYVVETDENLYRRSIYTFRKRTVSHPTLGTFDAPSWELCQAKRALTNTPLQALALLNDTTYVEAARHLASRMMAEGGSTLEDQLRCGYLLVAQRAPNATELSTLAAGYARYLAYYEQHTAAAVEYLSQGISQLPEDQKTPEMAAMSTVAAILLNLDEAITK